MAKLLDRIVSVLLCTLLLFCLAGGVWAEGPADPAAQSSAPGEAPSSIPSPTEQAGLSGFTDTRGHWAWAWIELAYRRGMTAGVSPTRFAPNDQLTRAMFVTLLYRAAGTPEISLSVRDESGNPVRKAYFSDVPEGCWYEIPVFWAYESGITAGVGDGLFLPDRATTREQMCVFLMSFARKLGKLPAAVLPQAEFADDAQISAWAKESVYALQRSGLVVGVGDGRFAPQREMTRAEAVALLMSYLRATGQLPPRENLVNPAQDIDYAALRAYLLELAIEYPDLIHLSVAGSSYEGREIPLVRFGKGTKYIYTQANIHAREHQTTNFVLEMLDEYACAYEGSGSYDGYNVRSLLDTFTLVILPRANPDGANIAQKGFDAAKDPAAVRAMIGASKGSAQWKSNAQGTDLNRNFPCYWAATGTGPASENYGGPAASSAPETKVILSVMQLHSYVCFLDIHMAGNVIYFCNTGISSSYYNSTLSFAQQLCSVTGYKIAYSGDIQSDHSGAAYARNRFRVPALTVELTASTVFPHNSANFYSEIWSYVKDLYLEAMRYYQ